MMIRVRDITLSPSQTQKDLHKKPEAAALYQKILQCLHLEYPYQENWIEQIHSKLNC